jgi:hypothetical protein
MEVLLALVVLRGGSEMQETHGREEEEICQAIEAADLERLGRAIEEHMEGQKKVVLETLF